MCILADFDIGVSKPETEQKKSDRGFRDDSRREFRGGRGSGFKDDSRGGKFSGRGGSKGGFQGSKFGGRQNGFDRKPFDSEPKWGSRSGQDERKRKPLQLEPRSEGRSQGTTSTGVKESPFGNATPVEVKVKDTPTSVSTPESTPKKSESPFGDATPIVPPKEKLPDQPSRVDRTETKESPSWRTRKEKPSTDFKKKDSDKRRFQGKNYDNGNPFSKPRKDNKFGGSFNKRKEYKGSDSWNEVKSSEGSRKSSQSQTTTSNVKTDPKNDQNMVNSFAVLGDMEDSE